MFSLRMILVGALLAAGAWTATAQAPDLSKMDLVERCVPDGPIASVDGRSISREAFLYLYESELGTVAALRREEPKDADRISTAISCVTELIQREVLVSEAAKRKISVSDAEVEEAYKKELGQLQAGLQKKTETDILRDGGRTREEALAEMKRALLIERVREAIVKEKNVTVSDAEVKLFFDENQTKFLKGGGVHLKQIFVRPKPDAKSATDASWDEAKARIEKAIARIQTGENFEAVAKAVSEAPNRENGGDLGVTPVDKLPPFYRDAVTKMKAGELSPVIRSEFGLHIILLVSVEDEKTVTLDQVKDRVRSVLLHGKAEGVIDDFCRPIYDDTKRVQVFLSLERAIASIPESERPKAPAGEAKSAAKPAASKPAKAEPAKAEPAKAAPAKAAPAEKGKGKKKDAK